MHNLCLPFVQLLSQTQVWLKPSSYFLRMRMQYKFWCHKFAMNYLYQFPCAQILHHENYCTKSLDNLHFGLNLQSTTTTRLTVPKSTKLYGDRPLQYQLQNSGTLYFYKATLRCSETFRFWMRLFKGPISYHHRCLEMQVFPVIGPLYLCYVQALQTYSSTLLEGSKTEIGGKYGFR